MRRWLDRDGNTYLQILRHRRLGLRFHIERWLDGQVVLRVLIGNETVALISTCAATR